MKKLNKKNYSAIVKKLLPFFIKAGKKSIELSGKKLKIFTKSDKTPVSNGDLAVDKILQNAIRSITPGIEIVSEETIETNKVGSRTTFWLIDPIDGTSSYIKNKDEYTLNAALVVNKVPILGLVGVPKKNRLFFSYGSGESFLIENNISKNLFK